MSAVQGAIPRFIEELKSAGDIKGIDIANIADVSKATVSRWKSGDIKPQPNNELILSDLHYVVGRLAEYYSSEEIRTWLYARHSQLNGERAIDLIHDDRTVEILNIIERLDNEVYL
uniref:Antitoxin Xre/MbcA/ParS-like toxin-binding domain-containing protein n=1 Tax=OCS116 cluster bacterium TaxID=2030921 RepID=A0A2A4Z631_9PROT